jgi:gliding motility-associated-like protein
MPFVCKNDTFLYHSAYYDGNRYEWDLQPTGLGEIVSPPDSNEIKIHWQESGEAFLILKETIESTLCAKIADTFYIQINPTPVVKAFPENDAICDGDSAIVILSGADSYYWLPLEGLTNISDSSWIVKPEQSTSYKIVGISESTGCYDSTFYLLNLNPNPMIELGDPRFLYPGDPVRISAGSGYDSYYWIDGSTDSVLITYTAGEYWVNVEKNGCFASDTILVTLPLQSLPIPNAFTPNGDGINDKFNVVGINSNITYYRLEVFNRWGERIYETTRIDQGWDGTKNGKPCKPGVYRWIISFEEMDAPVPGLINKTGMVTLLR